MEYLKIDHILAAIVVLLGGIGILTSKHDNKPLKLLSFFLVAYMIEYIENSMHVWAVEMLLILSLTKTRRLANIDCKWYLIFLLFASISLFYSENPIRGVPGLFMYAFPLFYYTLATIAFRSVNDIGKLMNYISKSTSFLFVLSLPFWNHRMAYPYYGMAICSIPAIRFIITKKKMCLIQFIICMLSAFFWAKRTPLLGIAVGMVLFSLLYYRWKAVIPSVIVILFSVNVIINTPQFREKMFIDDNWEASHATFDTFDDLEDLDESIDHVNSNGRTVFWTSMLEKYHEKHPFFGAGQGTVKAFLQSDENELKDYYSLMHNDWLLLLCEIGIVGTSFLLFFFLDIIWKCIKYSSKKYPKELRLIAASCAASIGSTMVHMFFENCMNSFVLATCFVFYATFNYSIRSYQGAAKGRLFTGFLNHG